MVTKENYNLNPEDKTPEGQAFMSDSLFQIAWRNRWIILGCIVLAIAAGFVYVLKATPIYSSSSKVFVEQSGPRIITEAQGVMTQSKNYLYTQAVLMTSTPIINSALESPGISNLKSFAEIDNKIAYLKKAVEGSREHRQKFFSWSANGM